MSDDEKIVNMLCSVPLNELEWIRNRYCGRYNSILCYKKFGFEIPTELIDKIIDSRSFEETVLSDSD